jgi:hypothetical protein
MKTTLFVLLFPFWGCRDQAKKEEEVPGPSSPQSSFVDDGVGAEKDCREIYENKPENLNPKIVSFFFIRHAESEWNRIHAIDPNSSLLDDISIKDAPLSVNGVAQATNLGNEVSTRGGFGPNPVNEIHRSFLSGDSDNTVFATSNLRRAGHTLFLAFSKRIKEKEERIDPIHVLSSLQELSSGIDASSNSVPGGPPDLPFNIEYNSKCNLGDQTPPGSKQRLEYFCHWLIHQAIEKKKNHFVIVGHSIWLIHWFSIYLKLSPNMNKVENDFKMVHPNTKRRKRLGNAGLIYSQIQLDNIGSLCHIVPGTTLLLTPNIKIDYNS